MPNPYRRKSGRYGKMRGAGGSESAPEPFVEFTFTGSDAIPLDMFHLRRGLVGGTASRSYVTWTRDDQTYVVSFRHEGSGANPGIDGAEHDYCDLDTGTVDGASQAAAFALTAAGLDGGTWETDGATVRSDGATDPSLADDMDPDDLASRGVWGMQRDLGFLDGSTTNGAMGATGAVHLPSPGAGKVLGVGIRTQGGGNVRIALGRGPAYSTDPAAITILGQGLITAQANNDARVVLFAEAIDIAADDELWIVFRAEASQMLRFRDVANGFGDLVEGEQLIWSALTGNPATAFGATVDVGGGGGPFAIYAHVFLIWEAAPVNALDTWHGYQGEALAGTYDVTDPVDMNDETVTFRIALPPWSGLQAIAERQAIGTRTAGDDLGLAYFDWPEADVGTVPSEDPATLLRNVGLFGVSAAGGYNVHTLDTPLDLDGVAVLGVLFNCGRVGGANATSLQFIYNEDGGTAHWLDQGRAWSDFMDDGGFGQDSEYQTRESNGSAMVHGDPSLPQPSVFAPDDGDDFPLNARRGATRITRPGITAAEG